MSIQNIIVGWAVNDVVEFKQEWCMYCTKSRSHEVYQNWVMCLGCGNSEHKEPNLEEIKGEQTNG